MLGNKLGEDRNQRKCAIQAAMYYSSVFATRKSYVPFYDYPSPAYRSKQRFLSSTGSIHIL